ncbi:hypothetical protein LEMLEM_LOCUS13285, partial [Lemmus lemmus]
TRHGQSGRPRDSPPPPPGGRACQTRRAVVALPLGGLGDPAAGATGPGLPPPRLRPLLPLAAGSWAAGGSESAPWSPSRAEPEPPRPPHPCVPAGRGVAAGERPCPPPGYQKWIATRSCFCRNMSEVLSIIPGAGHGGIVKQSKTGKFHLKSMMSTGGRNEIHLKLHAWNPQWKERTNSCLSLPLSPHCVQGLKMQIIKLVLQGLLFSAPGQLSTAFNKENCSLCTTSGINIPETMRE